MTALAPPRLGRHLIAPDLFDRLVTFLESEEAMTRPRAERVMDQALAFIDMAGRQGGIPLSPSRAVDPGWHAFLLHSQEYADFCHGRFGRFLHHRPLRGGLRDGIAVERAVRALAEAGYAVDHDLWGTPAECNPPACCGDGDGC
ncbi:glycine-rich domain-containing protein [Streptomyces sp. NPDC055078]